MTCDCVSGKPGVTVVYSSMKLTLRFTGSWMGEESLLQSIASPESLLRGVCGCVRRQNGISLNSSKASSSMMRSPRMKRSRRKPKRSLCVSGLRVATCCRAAGVAWLRLSV